MSFIRNKTEEKTGYQTGTEFNLNVDFQNDFVMVYRINDTTASRIAAFRENGYEVHLMTGIAWGRFQDYLFGEYDGKNHMDEAQTDRYGNKIMHGTDTPYMVPTVAFADYLSEKLKLAVDAGVSAIHVEEPEFWDRGGYSEAFKREYRLFYRSEWVPAHTSLDAHYKTAKLKHYLYKRTIDRVANYIKEYALAKYNKTIRFYIPTHSLLNYTQWKIVSPEGAGADIPAVDGFIAQVWTGTSREKNFYRAELAERTFDTAYLEYGIMQELVSETGKKMWFLHDPIEDNPAYDWDDYRKNYLKTVVASLLHPKIDSYEICPWPHRVLEQKYPKNSADAKLIPPEYNTLLNGIFQTLGDIPVSDNDDSLTIGVLMSDSSLFQRALPDSYYNPDEICEKVGTVIVDDIDSSVKLANRASSNLATQSDWNKLAVTVAFPQFYGLALPLLKNGLAVRPVLLDNTMRYTGYLDSYKYLVLSYEFMKPDSPNMNIAVAAWVAAGGTLIYVGDGKDPFHGISSWWSGKYTDAAHHLFELLQISATETDGCRKYGLGNVYILNENPSSFCFNTEKAAEYRKLIKSALNTNNDNWIQSNMIKLQRGKYTVACVLDESESDESHEINGLYADMFSPDFRIIHNKTLNPGDNTLLRVITKYNGKAEIIGTCLRIFSIDETGNVFSFRARGATLANAYIRLLIAHKPEKVSATLDNGESLPLLFEYDDESSTVLLSFSNPGGMSITFTIE